MSLADDRALFIKRLEDIRRDPVPAFTTVLDDLIAWSAQFDWGIEFRDHGGSQEVVKYVLRGAKTNFWVAYPQSDAPTKLSIIDTVSGRVTKEIQDWARGELADLKVGQPADARSPLATFEALTVSEKLEATKKFLERLLSRLATQSPQLPDAEPEPPTRVKSLVSRVVRDTAVALWVKQIHEYRCQICGHRIELPDGRFYSEAHHIRPLGGGHDGPDLKENVLCVCPNHHVELDLGLRDIVPSSLQTVNGHKVGTEYVRYHKEVIRKRWA